MENVEEVGDQEPAATSLHPNPTRMHLCTTVDLGLGGEDRVLLIDWRRQTTTEDPCGNPSPNLPRGPPADGPIDD